MAKRRKRQPPAANRATAAPPVRTVDPDLLAKSDPARHERHRNQSFAKGVQCSASYAVGQDQIVARFMRWSGHNSIVLADHLADDGRGRQRIAAWVVTDFLVELARPGYITSTRWKGYKNYLLGGLKRLDVPVLVPDLDDEILRRVAAQLDSVDPRPAAPVFMGYGLEEIRDKLATETDKLWRAALLAFHLTAHWFGGRCVETVCNLRWKHIDIDDEHMTVTWPPSKYQGEAKAVRVRIADLPAAINPALALDELRAALDAAELDTTTDSRIFPAQRNGSWSLTLVEDLLADETFASDLTDDGRIGAARKRAGQHYYDGWTAYAKQTKWSKTVGRRRVSPHGLRRGIATLQARNGASLYEVGATLRHGAALSVTCRYIDPLQGQYADVVKLLVHDAEPVQVPESFAPDPDCFGDEDEDDYDGCLPVLDWGAGCIICSAKQDTWSAVVDDELVVLCGHHLAAYNRGEENWRAPRPCEVWAVVAGEKHTCDQPFDSYFTLDDGTKIPCCHSHWCRLDRARKRNETLTLDAEVGFGWNGRMVGLPNPKDCGVWGVHEGERHECDRPFWGRFTLDDGTKVPCCRSHDSRFRDVRNRGEELVLDPVTGLGRNGRRMGS